MELVSPIELYPVVVLQDRYGGIYSGGQWLAIAKADREDETTAGMMRAAWALRHGPHDGDVGCATFWSDPPLWIAVADTPDDAVKQLIGQNGLVEGET